MKENKDCRYCANYISNGVCSGDTITLDYGKDEYTCVILADNTNYEFVKSSS